MAAATALPVKQVATPTKFARQVPVCATVDITRTMLESAFKVKREYTIKLSLRRDCKARTGYFLAGESQKLD